MSHWAEIDNDGNVLRVTVGDNESPDEGYSWLVENLGGTWVQTSYTSRGGKRINPDTGEVVGDDGFRYNYAAIGGTYDANVEPDGAFIPPYPGEGYILDTTTYLWVKEAEAGE
jgi:hypothetical protein